MESSWLMLSGWSLQELFVLTGSWEADLLLGRDAEMLAGVGSAAGFSVSRRWGLLASQL